MALLAGINHVAFLSADIDRLKEFYASVFDAECVLDEVLERGPWENARHAFIDVGSACVLHPFESNGNRWLEELPIFDRGRIDHFALQTSSLEAFETLRQRLVDAGASDGVVTDFGLVVSSFFRDPDGMGAEIAYWKVSQ